MASEFLGIYQSDLPGQSMGVNQSRYLDLGFETVGNLKSSMIPQG